MTFFKKFAEFLYRAPEDSHLPLLKKNIWAKLALILGILTPLLGLGIPLLIHETFDWHDSGPEVSLPPESWHVLYHSELPSEHCATEQPQNIHCYASPSNTKLWQSPSLRVDETHNEKIRALEGKEFWIGAVIPRELLAAAYYKEANHLLLGYVFAEYEIWLDGDLMVKGNYMEIRMPIILKLPMMRLKETRDLHVAIKIKNTLGSVYPDTLGVGLREGLATAFQAEHYTQANIFTDHTRPAFFLGIYLILGGFFLFIWLANYKKQEYFYISAYALLHAFIQMMVSDLIDGWLNIGIQHRVNILTFTYEGSFAMFLGLSFARARPEIFKIGFPLFVAAPFLAQFFIHNSYQAIYLGEQLHTILLPTCYFIGGAACFIQGAYLYSMQQQSHYSNTRMNRLLLFGASLIALGVCYALEAHSVSSETDYVEWHRLLNLLMVIFLSGVVLREYKEQEKIVEKTPISPYHRRAILPERVKGAMLVIDMKDSEMLFRRGAEMNLAGSLVHTCLSHMWTGVMDNDGIILQTEGDLMRVFFEEKKGSNPVWNALKAAVAIENDLKHFSKQLKERDIISVANSDLRFRAAIVTGEIKPIWQEMNESRFAAWIETGSTNPFVVSSRLMDFEKELSHAKEHSVVMMDEELANTVEKLLHKHKISADDGAWLLRNTTMASKHAHTYCVAALIPEKISLEHRSQAA